MAKTRNDTDETTAVETGVQSEPKATSTPKKETPLFDRDDLACAKEFKAHKWLVKTVVKPGEMITKDEAQKRVSALLKKTV